MAARPAKERLTVARKVIRDLVGQFPDAPSLTLAKRAYREHPELWPNLEACRSAVRTVLGVNGDSQRSNTVDKSQYRKPRAAGWTGVIPEAVVQLEGWKALEVEGPQRCLVLADCHIPFHSIEALEVALEHGEKKKPTLILLNGDILDCYSVSNFEKDPKLRDFPAEVRAGRFFLKGLRHRFPRARILYRLGNHEERLSAYLRLKAPDLLGIPEFEWSSIFGLNENRIELVQDKRVVRLGKLNTLHGHEHRQGISAPVNPARGLFLRAKSHALCGHWHQASQHSETNVEQKVITTWSTGCLCDLHPRYAPINPWGWGVAFVEVSKDGSFGVENSRILHGRIW